MFEKFGMQQPREARQRQEVPQEEMKLRQMDDPHDPWNLDLDSLKKLEDKYADELKASAPDARGTTLRKLYEIVSQSSAKAQAEKMDADQAAAADYLTFVEMPDKAAPAKAAEEKTAAEKLAEAEAADYLSVAGSPDASAARVVDDQKRAEAAGLDAVGTALAPEIRARNEKMMKELDEAEAILKKFRSGAEKMTAKNMEAAKASGFERIVNVAKDIGERYNSMPWWKKLALGVPTMAVGLALGIPGANLPMRVVSGLGMFVTLDGLMQNSVKNKFARGSLAGAGAMAYAIFVPKVFSYIDEHLGVSDAVKGWFGYGAASPEAAVNPESTILPTQEMPPVQGQDEVNTVHTGIVEQGPDLENLTPGVESYEPHVQGGEYTPQMADVPPHDLFGSMVLGPGDSVWSLIEHQLSGDADFTQLDTAQKHYIIDACKNYLNYPNPTKIPDGTVIDFSKLNDTNFMQSIFDKAAALTDAQKANILNYRG